MSVETLAGLVAVRVGERSAARPLVALPGLLGDARLAARLLKPIARQRPVICLAPLGAPGGDVPAPDDPAYGWDQQAARLEAALDAAGIGEADVLGWSLGGVWAQHALALPGGRLRRGALAVTIAKPAARETLLLRHLDELTASELSNDALRRAFVLMLFSPAFLRRPGAVAIFDALLDVTTWSRAAIGAQLGALRRHVSPAGLDDGRVVAVLSGGEDWLFPPAAVETLSRHVGAQAERLAGSGHAVWVERPRELIAWVGRALPVPAHRAR